MTTHSSWRLKRSTGNKRLDAVIVTALRAYSGESLIALDGYNNKTTTDVIYAITTRVFGDNNHFLMEIYESDPNKCDC